MEPEPIKRIQPSPRQFIQPKSVWNDKKGRTWVCWEIWENGKGYYVDLMEVGGEKVIEFISRPWMDVHRAIVSGQMQRANI